MHYFALGVLVVSWTHLLWDTYLDYRQYNVYRTTHKVPNELKDQIDEETFKKAKLYCIDKARYDFVSSLYSKLQSTITIYYYLLPYFWDLSNTIMTKTFGFNRTESIEWEIFQSIVFTSITSIVSIAVNLPVSIYNTFVIEQRHGFNKQTAGLYAWDRLKMIVIGFVSSAFIVAAIVHFVRNGGQYFFPYLWMFCFVVVCLQTFLHGEIAALFDQFTQLPEGELRDKIEKLARDCKFPFSNIFVVEGSKRSAHSNAYQSGISNKKRIVIYDTLIEGYYDKKNEVEKNEQESTKNESDDDETDSEQSKEAERSSEEKPIKKKGCNHDEIIAVLCHELGHWYCGHLIKLHIFAQVKYFLIFLTFSRFYTDPTLYAAFGFFNEKPVVIGLALFMLITAPYNAILGFIGTSMSRRFEYQADEYAKKRGYVDQLKTALVKLNIDNLGFPVHDELYSTFYHSHPTLIQRLKALSKSE